MGGPDLEDILPGNKTAHRLAYLLYTPSTLAIYSFGSPGGGHTWPGGPQYLPEAIIGKTSREFNVSELIRQFFKEYPME
jgi:polyhydroxybutyrate depolymerase